MAENTQLMILFQVLSTGVTVKAFNGVAFDQVYILVIFLVEILVCQSRCGRLMYAFSEMGLATSDNYRVLNMDWGLATIWNLHVVINCGERRGSRGNLECVRYCVNICNDPDSLSICM